MYTLTGSLSEHGDVITSVICIRISDVHLPTGGKESSYMFSYCEAERGHRLNHTYTRKVSVASCTSHFQHQK